MKVTVREVLERTIEVDAKSDKEALDIVKGMYDREEIVLTADDYSYVDFGVEVEL